MKGERYIHDGVRMRCRAVTKHGKQCARRGRWTLAGVHLCQKHRNCIHAGKAVEYVEL